VSIAPPSAGRPTRMVKFTISGTANNKARQSCPVSGTIIRSRIYADVVGSAVVDIWKTSFGSYPASVTNTIINTGAGGVKPTLSSQISATDDTTLTGWTKTVDAGDTFIANLDSVTTCTEIDVELWILET